MSFVDTLWKIGVDISLLMFGYGSISDDVTEKNEGPLCISIEIGPDVIEDNIECSICLCLYKVEDPADLLICGHYFHEECYREWKNTCIENKNIVTCPVCRG